MKGRTEMCRYLQMLTDFGYSPDILQREKKTGKSFINNFPICELTSPLGTCCPTPSQPLFFPYSRGTLKKQRTKVNTRLPGVILHQRCWDYLFCERALPPVLSTCSTGLRQLRRRSPHPHWAPGFSKVALNLNDSCRLSCPSSPRQVKNQRMLCFSNTAHVDTPCPMTSLGLLQLGPSCCLTLAFHTAWQAHLL